MVLATTLGLLLGSCKKDKDNKETDYPSEPVAGQLQIHFDQTTVELARIDSGFVILQREGSATQIMKRFVKGNQLLKIDIDGMPEAQYSVAMVLDMKLKNDNKFNWRQFRWKQDVRLINTGVAIKAPVNELKKDWKVYCVMSNPERSYSFTIPLDCTDPYFEAYVKNKEWDYLYLERNAFKRNSDGTKTRLDAMHYECANNCFDNNGNLSNAETFKNWAALVGTKEWHAGEFFIKLLHQEGEAKDILILYDYDIPDLQ